MPTMHNKNGTLTSYAFACGYIERKELNNTRIDLWLENNCWHVRAHEFNGKGRLFWETFNNLTEARKFYRQQKQAIFS